MGAFLFAVLFLFGAVFLGGAVFHHALTFCLDPHVVTLYLLMLILDYAASLPPSLMTVVGQFAFCLVANSLLAEFVFLPQCATIV